MGEAALIVALRPAPQRGAVRAFLDESWGEIAAAHDRHWRIADLDALVAERADVAVGTLTFEVRRTLVEIVTIDARPPGRGVGTALLDAVAEHARGIDRRRLTVTTTNDNLPALGFYQANGFHLARLWPNAIATARLVKPHIPLTGHAGLPIRDEIDLEREI